METLIKLNNQTVGRDKIARLLQYLSRVLWNKLQENDKDRATNVKNLEYQLSTFRKLLRFGKCLDVIYATLPLFRSNEDSVVTTTLILSKIASSLFLFGDHILWLGRADLCNINNEKWSKISNKYWLYSITMNLVRDFYEIAKIYKSSHQKSIQIKNLNDFYKSLFNLLTCLHSNRKVTVDTIKNACDFFIPLTALGYVKLSQGTVGWLGVVSSIAGLLVLIDPLIKLSPS